MEAHAIESAAKIAEMEKELNSTNAQVISLSEKMDQMMAMMAKNLIGREEATKGKGTTSEIPPIPQTIEDDEEFDEEIKIDKTPKDPDTVASINPTAIMAALRAHQSKQAQEEETSEDIKEQISKEVNKAVKSALKPEAEEEVDLFCFPKIQVPPKFKIPNFEKYDGTTNPDYHVKGYCATMVVYSSEPAFLLTYFHTSLKGAALRWFMKLGNEEVKSWSAMVKAFREYFKYNIQSEMTRESMVALRRKPNETFREYASRWREASIEVQPPMSKRETCRYFVKALSNPAYDILALLPHHDFAELVTIGEDIDSKSKEASPKKNYTPNYGKKREGSTNYTQGNPQSFSVNAVGSQGSNSTQQPQNNRNRGDNNWRKRELPNLGMTREQLFYYLKDKGMICVCPGKVWDPPYPAWYKPELTCIYHQDAKGHSIDTCDQFKSRILQMIDAGWINVPNITKNPLPAHGVNAIHEDEHSMKDFAQTAFTSQDIFQALITTGHISPGEHCTNKGSQQEDVVKQFIQLGVVSINRGREHEHFCAMATRDGSNNLSQKLQEVPFVINFFDKETPPHAIQASPLFTINKPGIFSPKVSIPFSEKAVPWDYKTTSQNKKIEPPAALITASITQGQGFTRSGRMYAKASQSGISTNEKSIPESTEISRKDAQKMDSADPARVEIELEKEFLSIVKKSDYDIVEQLNKTPSRISMLALVLTSEAHRQALMRVLTAAHVPTEITPEKMISLIDVIKNASTLAFSDEEVCPGMKALHITVKCFGFTVAKVLVDGGSALNVLPLATFQQLPVESTQIDVSNVVVRAFDGTRREVLGGVTLPIEIGPVTFDVPFQLMEVDAAYTMLLGRPWIHNAKAIPSTLHQKVKFIRDDRIITIKGEESMLISHPSPIPFIDSTEAALESSFQGLELEEAPFQINSVAVKIMAKQGYQEGRGLGPTLNGIPRCIKLKEREAQAGIGYEGSRWNISHHKKQMHLDQLFVPQEARDDEAHIAVIEKDLSVRKDKLIWRSDEGTNLGNWEADYVLSIDSTK